MVRGRFDRAVRPYRKSIERARRRWLRSLLEEQRRRGWVVVTGFWLRIENPGVVWRRAKQARRLEPVSAWRAAVEELARELLVEGSEWHRILRLLAAAVTPHPGMRRERRAPLSRMLYDALRRFVRGLLSELRRQLLEWLRDSWLYKLTRKAVAATRLYLAVRRLLREAREGTAIPLFEAMVTTVDGIRIWRVVAVDQLLMQLPAEVRQRIIESVVAIIERGRPMYRDWLNPFMRILLSMLVAHWARDHCHHKAFVVRATPVVIREVVDRRVKRVAVFLRFVRVDAARADPLLGRGAVISDPVLVQLMAEKPEGEATTILNARKRWTPYTRAARALIEYPEMLLAIDDRGVRRALALALGKPEDDGVDGVEACSLYLGPATLLTHEDWGEDEALLLNKFARRRYGRPHPGLKRGVLPSWG